MLEEIACSLCGGREFIEAKVLWPELITEWQLTEAEVEYIDRQQGSTCSACGMNLRGNALGRAMAGALGAILPFRDALESGALDACHVLDLNGVPGFSAVLPLLPHYQRVDFPDVDMHALPFDSASFDLVIHSDTLEHVANPLLALEECRRVLKPGGCLCFTVPIVVGRLTRSRAGLAPSYHGTVGTDAADFIVHTEFGADAWTMVLAAGFIDVTLTQVDYPAAIAITARKGAAIRADGTGTSHVADESALIGATPPVEPSPPVPIIYDQDGLRTVHNHEFMADPAFAAAYDRGVQAVGTNYRWHWRVHVGLWAASTASKLPGDFVEFGVNRGFLSSAIMQMLDWNSIGRTFYLLDTFNGVDERYVDGNDLALGVLERNKRELDSGFYTRNVDEVRANFSQWSNTRLIVGPVPETLPQIDSSQFAFVHIDMNCAAPEVAAAEFIWPRLVAGGIILLDDYAYEGYRSQKLAMDEFARNKRIAILSLPTGQGLMIKPPHGD